MKVVIDIEANGLENPSHIWLIVCKDIDTGELYKFRNVTSNPFSLKAFLEFADDLDLVVGHNLLGYDYPNLERLTGFSLPDVGKMARDTLIISKLVDFSRKEGHSIEDYGLEFGFEKKVFLKFTDKELFNADSLLFRELEEYCVRDVDICERIYRKYLRVIDGPDWDRACSCEHKFQLVVNALHDNGFAFDITKATSLLKKVEDELGVLDPQILEAFPPREELIREFTPKATKFGTISRSSIPRQLLSRVDEYEIGKTYRHTKLVEFNPSSHPQIIKVLNEAGWKPVDKTTTHIETERELNRLKYGRGVDNKEQVDILNSKLERLRKTGWKVNETNLETLPPDAPSPARLLAKRILLEARRRTLTEWLGLVQEDSRIHGKFYSIGAWTHRMAHQNPNTANIPTDVKLFGGLMRSLWRAPRNRLLVGVDAEGIQLRVFAHYIDDKEFTNSLVNGKKDDKSDPHSLNQRILGAKSRNIAKRFIFAYLLGGGLGKLAQILEVPEDEGRRALERLLDRYKGLQLLKETVIPADARRGYFTGLDGRLVRLPGETAGQRKHLCMSGYLQNGEAIIMKMACLKWIDKLKDFDAKLVNFVHDEWQTECPNNMEVALEIAKMQADSLREVGEELKLKCPLAGSYWNDDLKDYTIGVNWKVTH